MGSTTAFIALDMLLHNKQSLKVKSVDLWLASRHYVLAAKRCHDMHLEKNEDLLPYWNKNIEPFLQHDLNIEAQKKNILYYKHEDESHISLIVDDICKEKRKFDYLLKKCSKYFIPGETIIMMLDYYFYETKKARYHHYQKKLMKMNKKSFEFVERIPHSMCAVYRYLGGKIRYPQGEEYYAKR